MIDTHDEVTNHKLAVSKEVNRIMNIKDEKERLRSAFNLWLLVNPKIEVSYSDGARAKVTAKVAYKQTLEKIRFLREQHDTKYGVSHEVMNKKGVHDAGWRGLLEFPPGSMEFMKMFAVNLFAGDAAEQKKAAIKLSKIFPELQVPEVI